MAHLAKATSESGVVPEIHQPQAGKQEGMNVRHQYQHGNQHGKNWKPKLRHRQAQWHWRNERRNEHPQHHRKYQDCTWQKHHVLASEADFGSAVALGNRDDNKTDVGPQHEKNKEGTGFIAGQELLSLIRGTNDSNSAPDAGEMPLPNTLDAQVAFTEVHHNHGDILDIREVQSCGNAVIGDPEEYNLSESELPPELWALLIGDETLQGPDGELYDIFYPNDLPESDLQNLFQADSPNKDSSRCHSLGEGMHLSSPLKLTRASSAEDCLEDLLQEMHHGVLERYPTKQQLFSAVHAAAETALGTAFARLALVGSTAMQVDTPTSDLDVVVFTRHKDDAPQGVEALRWIAAALRGIEPSLRLELIDCAKVPILVATTADGDLSIDVSVDQPLAESHVLWFQMQHEELPCQGPLHRVPTPAATAEWGHHAALCRVLKWWLSRRGIPCAKEGGYPSLVWLLMAMHSVRCSLFVDQADAAAGPHGLRHLLGALGAFFDRFSRPSGFWGAIVFADGMHSEFWLHRKAIEEDAHHKHGTQAKHESISNGHRSLQMLSDFAVFDPARPEPADLAVRMSPATWLLFAFELERAAHLTALALSSITGQNGKPEVGGRAALSELFSQVNTTKVNTLPTVLPEEACKGLESSQPLAGIFLTDSDDKKSPTLKVGIVSAIEPNAGWSAPFLHRRDVYSRVHVHLCDLYGDTLCVPRGQVQALRPFDFVCGVQLRAIQSNGNIFEIAESDVQRLAGMNTLVSEERV
jgi:hypothetical protein